jgi:formate dehydrogenase alpha subunit
MTNSIADFAKADLLFVIGSNTTECHPMIGRVIRQAVKLRGAKLIVADARVIDLAKIATLHLRHKPGTDVALLNAMMHVMIAENLHDKKFVRERTEGFERFSETVRLCAPETAEKITGVSRSDIAKAARLFAGAERASVLYGMGITQHTTGTDNVKSLANLVMLTGNIGREGTGLSPLRGQNNVQGACDVGALPNVLPGYQPVSDKEKRETLGAKWGVGALPEKIGLTMGDMIQGALEGRVKAMYIMGENPVMSDPDMHHTSKSLRNLEFLVVQDIFPTETAVMADVILPAAAFAEKEGTFTNTERRVQRVRKALEPPGEAKSDWEIITLLAQEMGCPFVYKDPEMIMKEIAYVTPIYGGIQYDRLEPCGLQWPCPDKTHPGTAQLHQNRFIRGAGKFDAVEYRPPAESVSPAYPLILTTGRVLEHYHAGSMSRRSEVLNELRPSGAVEIHPEDASRLCLVDGDMIALASARGKIEAAVHVTDRTAPGLVFMAFHWKESPVNVVTNPALDPSAKIPEFKVAAISAVLGVLDRATQDNAFFARLAQNPAEALKEYELTPEERAAIVSGDIRKIESWVGKLDERLKRWLIARLQQEKW